MQPEGKQKLQSWKLNVRTRAKAFRFKLEATRIEHGTSREVLKFSLFFRFCKLVLHVKSELGTSFTGLQIPLPQPRPRTLRSKCLRFFQKLKTPLVKKWNVFWKKSPNLQYPDKIFSVDQPGSQSKKQKPIGLEPLLVGSLALLSKSISEKNQMGTIFHALSIFIFVALLFKKYVTWTSKGKTWVLLLPIVTLGCAVVLRLNKYMKYDEAYVWALICKGWNYAASSGLCYVLSQVVFSRFCQSVGA